MKHASILVSVLLVACNDGQARTASKADPQAARTIRLEAVGGRFRNPVYLASPLGDARLFIVEQAGRIRIVKNGATLPTPFLDISERVRSGGEQGLLSVAFHPDYRTNGFFFVNFTDRQGDTRVEKFKVGPNPDVADGRSARLVIAIDQPYSNHNGGHIQFGPDGMLWIGMGDGGSGGDPRGNGQDRRALLAKMLRIDVNRGDPYSIPANNPYADGRSGRGEVWAIGLRNPWRFAFDRPTGLLYIADVGQSAVEEIHVEPAAAAGLNYGWNIMEGDECYGSNRCNRNGLRIPAVAYKHGGGVCSVTGGHVYRGRAIPALAGHYFYSDYCAGWLRSFRYQNGQPTDARQWKMQDIGHVVSFGEDASGELYILSENGGVFRFAGAN